MGQLAIAVQLVPEKIGDDTDAGAEGGSQLGKKSFVNFEDDRQVVFT